MGIFWRILIIEVILLVGTLLYERISRDSTFPHLFWYAFRIPALVGIIIVFMMLTLQRFLKRKIIAPLEAISEADERFRKSDAQVKDVDLPEDAPREIRQMAVVSVFGKTSGVPKRRKAAIDILPTGGSLNS